VSEIDDLAGTLMQSFMPRLAKQRNKRLTLQSDRIKTFSPDVTFTKPLREYDDWRELDPRVAALAPDADDWSPRKAMREMSVQQIPYETKHGEHVLGYSIKPGKIAVSAYCATPFLTLVHELAHVLLEHFIYTRVYMENEPLRELEVHTTALAVVTVLGIHHPDAIREHLNSMYYWQNLLGRTLTENEQRKCALAVAGLYYAGK
jgi:hypothetical protein